jgi:hypothetical protein
MRGASKKIKVPEEDCWVLLTKVTFGLENRSKNIQIRNGDNCLPFQFLFVFLSGLPDQRAHRRRASSSGPATPRESYTSSPPSP